MRTGQLSDFLSDFEEWPERWMGVNEDLEYGRGVLEAMRPFVEALLASDMSIRTVRDHLDFLWLLGGEIIREVSTFEEYEVPPLEKLRQSVSAEGGPSCRHLSSRAEAESYHRTCRKLVDYFGSRGIHG